MNARWRKASRSSESANCVELAVLWRKAGRSTGNGNCVEVARLPVAVLVRDSKRPEGGYHTVTPAAFGDLLATIKRGELDL